MKNLTLLIALMAALFSTAIFADCNGIHCRDVTITRMYVQANGDTIISTSGDESKLSCDADSNVYITLSRNASNYEAVYALLLAAHTQEKPIWVRASDSGACLVNYVVSDL